MSAKRAAARPFNLVNANNNLRLRLEEDRDWVSRALCLETDPDKLFVGGAAQRTAAVFCRHCPVKLSCAADALDNAVEYGIWGGLTERQRRALLKQHPDVASWADFLAGRRSQVAG